MSDGTINYNKLKPFIQLNLKTPWTMIIKRLQDQSQATVVFRCI